MSLRGLITLLSCVVLLDIQSCLAQTGVRLVNGPRTYEGRVELYVSGRWLPLCADQWDLNDADVVCRQLGYYYAIVANENQYGSATTWDYDLDCTGRESTVSACTSSYSSICFEGIAGVVCSTSTLSTGDLRLAESDEYQYGGRLEYYYLGSWGTVCDDGWGYDEADVACDQMGFSYVSDSLLTYVTPGSPSQSIWVDDVRCSGYESRLSSCSGSFTGRHDCFHSEDVGIVCSRSYVPAPTFTSSGSSSSVGIAIGITMGTICLIMVSIVCCVGIGVAATKNSSRRRRRTTVVTAPTLAPSTTTTTTTYAAYPDQPTVQGYAAPPQYGTQPVSYPVQPPPQPTAQGFTNQPPQGEYPAQAPPPQFGFAVQPPLQAPPPESYPTQPPPFQAAGGDNKPPPYNYYAAPPQ